MEILDERGRRVWTVAEASTLLRGVEAEEVLVSPVLVRLRFLVPPESNCRGPACLCTEGFGFSADESAFFAVCEICLYDVTRSSQIRKASVSTLVLVVFSVHLQEHNRFDWNGSTQKQGYA
jgi:hypothetical protein